VTGAKLRGIAVGPAVVVAWLLGAGCADVDGGDTEPRATTAVVTRVVDGDTVELDNGRTVRLIGIDTPEVYGGDECGGAQASTYMERIATDRRVSVRTDPTQDTYDRYGRLLAYLDAGGRDLGEAVLRAGWARVYVYDEPFRRLAAYRQVGSAARGGDRGIWGSC
jgi:endonuclease YncB( thermonuclease family)